MKDSWSSERAWELEWSTGSLWNEKSEEIDRMSQERPLFPAWASQGLNLILEQAAEASEPSGEHESSSAMHNEWQLKGSQAERPDRSQLIIKSLMQITQDRSGVGVWRWGTERQSRALDRARETNSAKNQGNLLICESRGTLWSTLKMTRWLESSYTCTFTWSVAPPSASNTASVKHSPAVPLSVPCCKKMG